MHVNMWNASQFDKSICCGRLLIILLYDIVYGELRLGELYTYVKMGNMYTVNLLKIVWDLFGEIFGDHLKIENNKHPQT